MVALLWLLIWIVVAASLARRGASGGQALAAILAGAAPVLIWAAVLDLRAPPVGGHAQLEVSNLLVAGVLCGFYALVAGVAVILMRRARRED